MTKSSRPMGPCPACRRHVFVSDERCPFCGATWRPSAGGLVNAAAAASIILSGIAADAAVPAPVPDAVRPLEQEKYGGPREESPRANEHAWVWKRLCDDWRSPLGLSRASESWASRKLETSATYVAKMSGKGVERRSFTTTYKLIKVTDTEIALQSALWGEKPVERALPRKAEVAAGTKEGVETVEVDGRKFECEVRIVEHAGRKIKTWLSPDAPFGWVKAVSGEETTRLAKSSETLDAGGKKYACSRWETVNGNILIREWRSTDVPGLTVKWEETLQDPKAPAAPVSVLTISLTAVMQKK